MRFDSRGLARAYSHSLAGTALPGRAARGPVHPRKAACQFRRACICWSKVADARKAPNRKGPGCLETRASRVPGAKGAVSFPKQDALNVQSGGFRLSRRRTNCERMPA